MKSDINLNNNIKNNVIKKYYIEKTKVVICNNYIKDKKHSKIKRVIEVDRNSNICRVIY